MRVMEKKTVGDITLTVSYDEDYHVMVEHKDGRALSDVVECTYEPVFGIDVADWAEIEKTAEELARELEK